MAFLKCLIFLGLCVCSCNTSIVNRNNITTQNEVLSERAITGTRNESTLLRSAATCDCGWRNQRVLRIVGGNETGINEFPAMAGVVSLETNYQFCGATIIASRYLLTAGHCLDNLPANSLAILVGDHNISSGFDTPYSALYLVSAYEIHPNYVNPDINDIAIIQTQTEITFSAFVGPICLPFRYAAYDFTNVAAILLGWGAQEFSGPKSDVLRKVTVNVISNAECSNREGEPIGPNEICNWSEGKDSCQFDSGGPLLWTDSSTGRMHQIGIISHGLGCAFTVPGINTRVTYYLNWILSRTPEVSYCYR